MEVFYKIFFLCLYFVSINSKPESQIQLQTNLKEADYKLIYRILKKDIDKRLKQKNADLTNPFGAKLIIKSHQIQKTTQHKETLDIKKNFTDSGLDLNFEEFRSQSSLMDFLLREENPVKEDQIEPGAGVVLTRNSLNAIRDRLIPYLMSLFDNFPIDAKVDSDGIKMDHIEASLTKMLPQNLTYTLLPNENAFILNIKKPNVYIKSNLQVNKVLSFVGKLEIVVEVEEIQVKVFLIPEEGKKLMKPKIKLELLKFDLPSDKIIVSVDLAYVPTWLSDMIIFFIKGNLLNQVRDLVKDYVPNDLCNLLNDLIQEGYPAELPVIFDDMHLPILLTKAPVITPNQVHLFVDGYIYSDKTGKPETRRSPSPVTLYTPSDQSISISVSDETVASFFISLLKSEFQNHFNLISEGETSLEIISNIDDGMLTIDGKNLFVKELEVVVDSKISGKPVKYRIKGDMGLMLNYIDFNVGVFNLSVNSLEVLELELKSDFEEIMLNEEYFKNIFVSSIRLLKDFTYKFGKVEFPLYIELSRLNISPKKGFAYVTTSLSFYG